MFAPRPPDPVWPQNLSEKLTKVYAQLNVDSSQVCSPLVKNWMIRDHEIHPKWEYH